jgi:membrane protease YdiL (CAAX protease family)
VWWVLWHAPIDLARGFGPDGVGAPVLRLVWTLPLTVLFTWVTVRAGGSLLPAFALHATIKAMPDFGVRDPGRHERAMGLYVAMLVVAGIVVAVVDRRCRWDPGTV